MTLKPLISVCITTYNHELFLEKALDSVLMQQGDFSLEILLGEDGSTDTTAEIVKRYAERHPDIIRPFFHDPADKLFINGRQTGRKNFLNNLQQARGEFIALLDGDDYWLDPNKLQKQLSVLQDSPQLVACCHAAIYVDDQDAVQDSFMGHHDVTAPYRDFNLRDVLQQNPVPTLSVLFRRQPTAEYPALFTQTDMADWPLNMLNALRGDIRYLNEKLAAYRVHAGGVWAAFRNNREKTMLSEIAVWKIIQQEPLFAGEIAYLDALIQQQYGKLAKLAIKEQDYPKAWAYWRSQKNKDIATAWKIVRQQIRQLFGAK